MGPQGDALAQLLEVMKRLRDPQTGCAWDLQQNFRTIAPFTIEEAYEVADAIERDDLADLQDELGDLLFQVVFHAQMASEAGAFTFNDVAQGIVEKMIRRHPHVFGATVYETEAQLKHAWESIKARERAAKQRKNSDEQADGHVSALDGIAINLPSVKRADKVQKRAARVGFDWPEVEPVWDKLDEEVGELREAIEASDTSAIEDELGDLLFTVVNLARHCSVDSDSALQRATMKFDRRFRRVEQLAYQQDKTLSALDLSELEELWQLAKQED